MEENKEKDYLENWKRERADFLNYKKDEAERVSGIIKMANEDFITEILFILDSFEIAEKEIPEDLKENDNVKGLLQIKNQIKEFLKIEGVEEIKAIGEKFDPNFHEALEEAEGEESGMVVEEIKKGYTLNSKVIRPAKVKITK